MNISEIGHQFGLNEAQTRQAIEALAPVVAAGVRRSAQTPQGVQDVMRQVLTGGYQDSLHRPTHLDHAFARPRGDQILQQAFGDKDISRGVAQQLSGSTGIGAAILKKLMPIVASIVMGQIAKRMGAGPSTNPGGGFGDILRDILGGGGGGGMSLPGGGGGGTSRANIPSLPDAGLGGGGRANVPEVQYPKWDAPAPEQGGGAPAPGRTGNPLEDMLNDILSQNGGKGGMVVKQIPPEQMGQILKDIFGGKFPGSMEQLPTPQGAGVDTGRRTIEELTGARTRTGNAAEDLLNSVTRSLTRG